MQLVLSTTHFGWEPDMIVLLHSSVFVDDTHPSWLARILYNVFRSLGLRSNTLLFALSMFHAFSMVHLPCVFCVAPFRCGIIGHLGRL